jgi:purine-binding chemotaxis protein CheW
MISVRLGPQILGINVAHVHDVIRLGALNKVPLAPGWVEGVMNLRGRIVTAINLRMRFALPPRKSGADSMCVVIEHRGEPYGLIVDAVGDVIDVADAEIEANPVTLDERWQQVSDGVVKLESLMVVANVTALMDADLASAA